MSIFVRFTSLLLQGSLALFPPGYRREYREEHAWVQRLALAEAAECGGLSLLRFITREVGGIPLAILQAYQNEWRLQMNSFRRSSSLPADSLAGPQYLWVLIPFILLLVYSLSWAISVRLRDVLVLALLFLMLGVVVAGLIKRLPLWALPSLGLVVGLLSQLLFSGLIASGPSVMHLKAALWTRYMPSRVLYALILDFLTILPGMLLLVGLALLSTRLPALSTFRVQLGQDWTRLAFLLYIGNLISPLLYDEYRGREPYEALFFLILAGGAWLYLRGSRPVARLAALLLATLLSGLILALGIYLLYPLQEWVISGNPAGFPRWWESVNPLFSTLVFMVSFCLMAAFGSLLSRAAQPEAVRL